VHTHAQVEVVLADDLGHVLVDHDTSGFEGFRRQLLLLTRAQVHAEREIIDSRILATNIVDANLGICALQCLLSVLADDNTQHRARARTRHTTAIARLDVRLVLAIAIATSGTYGAIYRQRRSKSARATVSHTPPNSRFAKPACPAIENHIKKDCSI